MGLPMKKKSTDFVQGLDKEKKEDRRAMRMKAASTTREIRWDKLDNTAHLFPVIAGESMSNVYRISVTLTELINPSLQIRVSGEPSNSGV